jgi:hypothetical protein
MTIQLIGRFSNLYDSNMVFQNGKLEEILNGIKRNIVEDNCENDPDIKISNIRLIDEPLMYGMDGGGELSIEVTVVTLLPTVTIKPYEKEWDYMIMLGKQNKYDYTYDEAFFYNYRAAAE